MPALSPPSFPTVHRTEVDGVPLLWAEAPGEATVVVQFRVGRVDERPADSGLTHLVEHLSMGELGQPRYDHNAMVDGTRTIFYATGSDDELRSFLDVIGTALSGLPVEGLDRERDVLRREGVGRQPGIVEMHLNYRFGMTGHGLIGQPEFGLGRTTGERLQAWAGRYFVRGNAMAMLTGAPPADLRLALPDGERATVPALTPEPSVTLPSHIGAHDEGVALGFLLSRELGAGTMMAILHRRLRQRLRLDRGLIYDLLADYTPLDATWAGALIGGECDPGAAQEVTDIALEELDRLAAGDVTAAELEEEVDDFRRGLVDPTAVGGLLDAMVSNELLGMPPRGPAERYEEQLATTAEHIATSATEARRSMILFGAAEHHPDDIVHYPMTSESAVAGREVKPLLARFGLGPKQRLFIGPDGVTIRAKDGSFATVRYEDCVVLERPNEDDLVMWGRDTLRLWVPGPFWRGGEAILAEIEAALPADIVVREVFSHDYIDG